MQPPAPTAAERDSVCDADVKKKKKRNMLWEKQTVSLPCLHAQQIISTVCRSHLISSEFASIR